MKLRVKALIIILLVSMLTTGCGMVQKNDDSIPIIAPTLTVNFTKTIGKIKSLNGINNGPKSNATVTDTEITWGLDATEIYQELGIPYVRTHDTEYPDGSDKFIDIHCIFPDFSQDPYDPDAYHFEETDAYLANIQQSGAQIVYRLGESIAISVKEAKYQYPPEDFQKWAEICEHIIAHYNEGWNDGYEYDIEYWEIWNEPDQARQWIGEIEEYYELYQITARHLKEVFPEIKIGGGALASASEESVQAFLDGITDDGESTPLDFFSWHIYTNEPSDITYRANVVRKVLDDNQYKDTITLLDEWNYVDDWENIETTWDTIRRPEIAAFYGACMIAMQNSAVDGAMYYDGSLTGEYAQWCGLYTAQGTKLPGYYAFWAFGQLKVLGDQVEVTSSRDPQSQGIYVCAVSGESDGILLTNTSEDLLRFQLKSNSQHTTATFFRVNEDYPDGTTSKLNDFSNEEMIEMGPGELLFITLSEA